MSRPRINLLSLLLLLLLGLSLCQLGAGDWIVESIPRRRYSPQALALSSSQSQSLVDLSRLWRSVLTRRRVQNAARTKIGRLPGQEPPTRKTSEENACETIKTFPPNHAIPCSLPPSDTPMFVYFSFDDATTSWNIEFYRKLFADGRNNPNGCPIRATFFNSHENTQYDLLQELYDLGHEIASHSVSHKGPSTWWNVNATKADWYDEIVGQRDNIEKMTAELRGIPASDIRGMRAPFLAIGGDRQFDMLEENGFVYDSSIPNNNKEPSWPFTLHNPGRMNGPICRGPYCPTRPHAVWEAVMNVYYLDTAGTSLPCSMVDGCRPSGGRQGALEFLRRNFQRHYQHKNKVPFGISMHAAWFAFDGYIQGMDDFVQELLQKDDVYIVPVYKVLEWIQNPKPLGKLKTSNFGCRQ